MAIGVEELYDNLNELLSDICKFLTDEGTYEKLSPFARKKADELINRSKHQLQEIAKASIPNDGFDEAYVDMDPKPQSIEKIDEKSYDTYSSVEETTVPLIQQTLLPPANPFASLPARDLSQEVKYGHLSWRTRIILNFEKMKKIYAGVHQNWFLIYTNEKDVKPVQTFNLKFYKATQCKQDKTPPLDFELHSTLMNDKKTYYFIASTHKDMLQWVSHINRCNQSMDDDPNLIDNDDSSSETYDFIITPSHGSAKKNTTITADDAGDDDADDGVDAGEAIYHDIENSTPPKDDHLNINNNKPPELPTRRLFLKQVPLPPIPVQEPEITRNKPTSSSLYSRYMNNSFSDDDQEDNIYEPCMTIDERDDLFVANKAADVPEKQAFISKTAKIKGKLNMKSPVLVKPPVLKGKVTLNLLKK